MKYLSFDKKIRSILFYSFCIIFSLFLILFFCNKRLKRLSDAKSKLIILYNKVNLYEREDIVEEKIKIEKLENVEIYESSCDKERKCIVCKTPTEVGGNEWMLVFIFKDKILVEVRFMTNNEPYKTPIGAPKEKIADDIERQS